MKCQEKVSKILGRCRSKESGKSYSQSVETNSPQNRKSLKEKSPDKKCVKKLSRERINGMGENIKRVCRCQNCLGYEYGCQGEKMTSVGKKQYDSNNYKKYRLYAKLTKESDNSKEKFLHLKCKCDENSQECGNSISTPNLSQCSSKNYQKYNNCG